MQVKHSLVLGSRRGDFPCVDILKVSGAEVPDDVQKALERVSKSLKINDAELVVRILKEWKTEEDALTHLWHLFDEEDG